MPLRDLETISRFHWDLTLKKESSTSPLSNLRGQMLFHTEAGTRLGYVSLEDRGWSREASGLAKGGETFGSGTSPVPLP